MYTWEILWTIKDKGDIRAHINANIPMNGIHYCAYVPEYGWVEWFDRKGKADTLNINRRCGRDLPDKHFDSLEDFQRFMDKVPENQKIKGGAV